MDLGYELVCEFLPGRRVVLLLRVVEVRTASSRDQVDHSLRSCFRFSIKRFVERPAAIDVLASPALLRALAVLGNESKRKRSLIVMNMATEDEIHTTGL